MSLREKLFASQRELKKLYDEAEQILNTATKTDRELTEHEKERMIVLSGQGKNDRGQIGKMEKDIAALENLCDMEEQKVVDNSTFLKGGLAEHGGWRVDDGTPMQVLAKADKAGRGCSRFAIGELVQAIVTGSDRRASDDVQMAMSGTSNPAGGYSVPSTLIGEFVDLARSKAKLIDAGVRTILTDASQTNICVVAEDPVFQAKSENAPFNDDDVALGMISTVAMTIGCIVTASREVIEDSLNISEIITNSLAKSLAQQLDYYGLRGGSGFTGLLDWAGVSTKAVGGALTWPLLAEAATKARKLNHSPTGAILNPDAVGSLTATLTGTDATSIQGWLNRPPSLENFNLFDSGNCPIAKGVVGDFTQAAFILRQKPMLEITAVGGEAFQNHQVKIKLTWRGNLAVLDPTAFTVLTGITEAFGGA